MQKILLGQSKKGEFFLIGVLYTSFMLFCILPYQKKKKRKMLKDFSDFSKIYNNLYYPISIITTEMAPFADWL